jgi:hypothetical protein
MPSLGKRAPVAPLKLRLVSPSRKRCGRKPRVLRDAIYLFSTIAPLDQPKKHGAHKLALLDGAALT